MSVMGYVLAIGAVCIDEYYTAESWISEGSKLMVGTGESVVGGMIPNAACVFAKLGVPTKFFDTLNNGPISHRLLEDLQSYGLDTSPVYFDDSITDSKCIIVQTPLDRTIFVAVAEKENIPIEGERLTAFREADYIYTAPCELAHLKNPDALMDDLKAHGVKIVFDVEESNIIDPLKDYLTKASVLFFNEFGFSAYCDGKSEKECIECLFNSGVEIITVTLGKYGSRTILPDREVTCSAYDFPIVDTTGAGDTYNSAFMRCIMEGKEIEYAAKFANMAASYAISVQGPKGGAVSADFVEKLFAEHDGNYAI